MAYMRPNLYIRLSLLFLEVISLSLWMCFTINVLFYIKKATSIFLLISYCMAYFSFFYFLKNSCISYIFCKDLIICLFILCILNISSLSGAFSLLIFILVALLLGHIYLSAFYICSLFFVNFLFPFFLYLEGWSVLFLSSPSYKSLKVILSISVLLVFIPFL